MIYKRNLDAYSLPSEMLDMPYDDVWRTLTSNAKDMLDNIKYQVFVRRLQSSCKKYYYYTFIKVRDYDSVIDFNHFICDIISVNVSTDGTEYSMSI